ncbi:hypothetical protein [Cellulomonas sp. URHD0024]|uniref:hypothetical protein n=1 Tax=Cellulomonas sp. URHD0024 TaxID=1302620 RepID=UPI00042A2328|nr:hypothetical protein [Cellulomonas sp. URHD0024]
MPKPADIPRYVDDRPLRFGLVPTVQEATVFPAALVRSDAPRAARHVVAGLLGLVVGALALIAFGYSGLSDHIGWVYAQPVAVALALVVAVVNWKYGAWTMYAVALVMALPALLAVGADPGPMLLGLAILVGGLVPTWRGDQARQRRWARTSALMDGAVLTAAQVVRVDREDLAGVAESSLWVTIASVDRPGLTWTVGRISGPDFQPRTGDPMSVWYAADDPEIAVVVAAEPLVRRARPF